jgi:PPK2 family polyphosphate:nucleotide phosphotransferase
MIQASQQQEERWRQNAAAVILSKDGKVLLGRSTRTGFWNFPQGGAKKTETMEHALAREVWEEVGISPQQYKVVKSISGLRYYYPPGNRQRSRWVGQEQTYFLLQCKTNSPTTSVDRSPEFAEIQWVNFEHLQPSLFPKFKRKVIKKVIDAFFPARKANAPRKKATKATPASDTSSSVTQQPRFSPSMSQLNRYLVTPGKKLNLKDFASDDRSLFNGTKEEALVEFDELRNELQELQKKLFAENKHRILVILQAMDAGGKDGCVKHVFSRIDPQGIRVVPFKKPTADELAHDFLWRIHKEVPGNGQIVVFNRSHYEDIIAVRVKKIFPDNVWKRRYQSVLDFERMLADEGTTIIKLFLNISKEEQKVRLESRLKNPEKLWKFQMDDLDDRNRWDEFQNAYRDLIETTAKPYAPWYIIPGDRKWYRNIVVARLMVEQLKALQSDFPKPTFDPSTIKIGD